MENKVLFWDFDGTLSHSNWSFASALYEVLTGLGIETDREAALAFMAQSYPWKTPMEDHSAEVGEAWWDAMFGRIGAFCRRAGIHTAQLAQILPAVRAQLTDVGNYGLYEDTLSTLEACRQLGFRNYLLTNNYPEILENAKKLGLIPYFTDFVVSSHVGYDKPRAELYAHAFRLAGCPEICYMIGDNPVADIGGAASAGWKTIYVHNGHLDTADHSVETLAEIPAIVGR